MIPILFRDSESDYLSWLQTNPDGFVVNSPRYCPANYMVLHSAQCRTISRYTRMAQPGGFTERGYVKVCSNDVEELRDWVKAHGRTDGTFSGVCGFCKPIPTEQ